MEDLMNKRTLAVAVIGLALLGFDAGINRAQGAEDAGKTAAVAPRAGGAWWGADTMQFQLFMNTLSQLNMTPDLTLDKATKQKLQAIQEEYNQAQVKFSQENREEFKKLSAEQLEAYKAKDQEGIKAAVRKQQELYAKGPKGEEFLAKAKAALAPEQLKVVEDKMAKVAADRKAMMEKLHQRQQENEAGNPGAGEAKD
jgi:hypothetical protein